jgi:hypothetical protein
MMQRQQPHSTTKQTQAQPGTYIYIYHQKSKYMHKTSDRALHENLWISSEISYTNSITEIRLQKLEDRKRLEDEKSTNLQATSATSKTLQRACPALPQSISMIV